MNIGNELLGKTIFLDSEKSYQVIWIANYNQRKYIYLLNREDYSDVLFCEIAQNDTLITLTNEEELYKIIDIMFEEINRFTM